MEIVGKTISHVEIVNTDVHGWVPPDRKNGEIYGHYKEYEEPRKITLYFTDGTSLTIMADKSYDERDCWDSPILEIEENVNGG